MSASQMPDQYIKIYCNAAILDLCEHFEIPFGPGTLGAVLTRQAGQQFLPNNP